MSQQIKFFKKNKADFSYPSVSATASQGAIYAPFVLNRSNSSAWVTTGSVDADLTTLEVNFGDLRRIDRILLVKHNFKSFKIEYWNGSSWTTFTSAIDLTNNTEATTEHSFTSIETTKLRLTVRGTMVPNSDKYLYQFIATELIGQLEAWPVIKRPTISRNRQKSVTLSGKKIVRLNVGAHSCELQVPIWSSIADIRIVEAIFDAFEGILYWPCGGDETQFSGIRKGYRKEDIYLVQAENEYSPEYYKGLYRSGVALKIALVEVVD